MKNILHFSLFTILLCLFCIFTSCEDYSDVYGEVNIHLIENFDRIGADSSGISASSVIYHEEAFIAYEDLLYYKKRNHAFGLSQNGIDSINGTRYSLQGLPFAVIANGELIYTGYFWPSYSSMSCQWVVADPIMVDMNQELTIELGYPGLLDGQEIEDHRNDSRILDIFARDGKLK